MKRSIKNMDKLIKDTRFVVIDVETTGLYPDKDRVCEISMSALENLEVVSMFSSLVNPGINIPLSVLSVHGISNKMVEKSPRFEDIAETVMDFISGSVLVGHNIEFDFGFLSSEINRAGYKLDDFILIDTVALSRKIYPIRNYKLKTVAEYLNISSDGYHRAEKDVEVTVKIFQNIIRTLKDMYNIKTLGRLINFMSN